MLGANIGISKGLAAQAWGSLKEQASLQLGPALSTRGPVLLSQQRVSQGNAFFVWQGLAILEDLPVDSHPGKRCSSSTPRCAAKARPYWPRHCQKTASMHQGHAKDRTAGIQIQEGGQDRRELVDIVLQLLKVPIELP